MSSRFVGETRRANSLIESTVCGCAPLRKPQIPSRQHVRSTTQIATEKWPLIPVRLNFWSRLCVTQKHSTFPECDCESRVCSRETWETCGSRLVTVVRCSTLHYERTVQQSTSFLYLILYHFIHSTKMRFIITSRVKRLFRHHFPLLFTRVPPGFGMLCSFSVYFWALLSRFCPFLE